MKTISRMKTEYYTDISENWVLSCLDGCSTPSAYETHRKGYFATLWAKEFDENGEIAGRYPVRHVECKTYALAQAWCRTQGAVLRVA